MLLGNGTSNGTRSAPRRRCHGHHASWIFPHRTGCATLALSCDHMPGRWLMLEPAWESLVRIERARDHGQALVEDALVRRLERPLAHDHLIEQRADLLGDPARVLEKRVEEVRALRVRADRVQRCARFHAEVLEAGTELLHLRGERLAPDFLALSDQREHDRRDGGLGAGRWNEPLGGSRRSIARRWRSVTRRRWGSVGRRSRLPERARRAGRESIHGSKIRQSAVSRNR